MQTWKKFLIGGLGGFAPTVINLAVVDCKVLLLNLTTVAVAGYALKSFVLFLIGGFWAWMHTEEKNPKKIFELGILAPALITAFINAANVNVPKVETTSPQPSASIIYLLPNAYADDTKPAQQNADAAAVKEYAMPKESVVQQLWRGFTASVPENVWFVIVGTYTSFENAKRHAESINKNQDAFRADVYAPYQDNKYYSVVLGSNLTYDEGVVLKDKAVSAGFPKDTYLWTFPRSKE